MKKGSIEMKNYMAKLRNMKKPNINSMKGDGFIEDAYNIIKKGANFIKDNKLLSKGLSAASYLLPQYNGQLQTASTIASSVGLGKKKRTNVSKKSNIASYM